VKVTRQEGPDEHGVVRVEFDCGCTGDFDAPDEVEMAGMCDEHGNERRTTTGGAERIRQQMIRALAVFVREGQVKSAFPEALAVVRGYLVDAGPDGSVGLNAKVYATIECSSATIDEVIRRYNVHAELVAALEALDHWSQDAVLPCCIPIEKCRAALAKAGGR